jgi:hypothetical protein
VFRCSFIILFKLENVMNFHVVLYFFLMCIANATGPVRVVCGSTAIEEKHIIKEFAEDLNSLVFEDEQGFLKPMVCTICDGLTKEHDEFDWFDGNEFECLSRRNRLEKRNLTGVCPDDLIQHYTVQGEARLAPYVLSPQSVIAALNDTIAVCRTCAGHLNLSKDRQRYRCTPPPAAKLNGYLIGEAIQVLKKLNAVEMKY